MLSESKYLVDFLVEFLGKKPQTLYIVLPYYMIHLMCKLYYNYIIITVTMLPSFKKTSCLVSSIITKCLDGQWVCEG